VTDFQTTDLDSILERTRLLCKTKGLSRVEKEDVIKLNNSIKFVIINII
jgi:hypothetical protein